MAEEYNYEDKDPEDIAKLLSQCWDAIEDNANWRELRNPIQAFLEGDWNDAEELWNDLHQAYDVDEEDLGYTSSQFMDELKNDCDIDDDKIVALFKFMMQYLREEVKYVQDDSITLPKHIQWEAANKEKDIEDAQKYINSMCPGAGFNDTGTNLNLLKCFAVSEANLVPAMTIWMEMFELSLINAFLNPSGAGKKPAFTDAAAWINQCRFPKNYGKNTKLIENAIKDFKNRLCGSTFNQMIMNKIEDDINVYITYILKMNTIINNILETNKECCPVQIDFVILGKEHGPRDDEKGNDEEDDDDDDDEELTRNINQSTQMNDIAALANPLPQGGIAAFLKTKDIKYSSDEISIKSEKTNRTVQDAIVKAMDDKRHKRIIVIIDRSKDKGTSNADNDMLLVYRLPKYDEIANNYNEEHMSWMTKRQIFPEWKELAKGGGLEMYKGAGDDIGDNGFIFSFHIHEEKRIKCEQFIKSQKLPFLPHHIIDVWPMYFKKGFSKIDDKFSKEYIYKNWKLQTKDARLMKWIQICDPKYFENLEKQHLKFQQK